MYIQDSESVTSEEAHSGSQHKSHQDHE